MTEKIRLFIAIDLPERVKNELSATAAKMGQHLPTRAVRWVTRPQMHLTLRFLGDTAVSQLPRLQEELTQLAAKYHAFQLRLKGVGAFPNRKRPRVVWAGLAGDLVALQKLQAELEDRMVVLGWEREKRPFSPHLTLGRVKDAAQMHRLDWEVKLAKVGFEVTAVHLVQSELRPSGAVYTVLRQAMLDS
jgi:2'-5' RNA ligase